VLGIERYRAVSEIEPNVKVLRLVQIPPWLPTQLPLLLSILP
jgi:hypothetical protein